MSLPNRCWSAVIVSMVVLLCSGCVPVLLVAGAVGGFGLSNDSAIGIVSAGYHQLWTASLDVLETERAGITSSKESSGVIKAVIGDVHYAIKIDSQDTDRQRLKVSARKYLLPKPHIAQEMYIKITKSLQ